LINHQIVNTDAPPIKLPPGWLARGQTRTKRKSGAKSPLSCNENPPQRQILMATHAGNAAG
ncbi:MAG: hypothetical protein RSK76_02135, partial [Clostridia bacterium]